MTLPAQLERFIDSNIMLTFGNSELIFVDEQEAAIHIHSKDKPNPHWFGAIGICFSFPMDLRVPYNQQRRIGRYQGMGGHDSVDSNICNLTLKDSVTGDKFRYKVHMITKDTPGNLSSMLHAEPAEYEQAYSEHQGRINNKAR
ncbi:hypothetical protein HY212_03790 [Candidatus Pacearchaeota archaeon]|nr:hypothetical protein [Candidatus Pacearchaeota archaeon]